MASGIAIDPKCIEGYSALSKRDHSAIILKINEDMTEVNVDRTLPPTSGEPETEWKKITDALPKEDCRFIICDFSWKESPKVVSSKIIMILWSAEDAPIRNKMIYASSMESVTSKMAVQKTIQATEMEEIAYPTIKTAVGK